MSQQPNIKDIITAVLGFLSQFQGGAQSPGAGGLQLGSGSGLSGLSGLQLPAGINIPGLSSGIPSAKAAAPAAAAPAAPSTAGAGPSSNGRKTSSGGKPMIDSINEYRKKAGLPELRWSERLAQNAYDTGKATNGKSMRHKLGSGSYGQVLSPGIDDDDVCTRNIKPYTPFELPLMGWLCERSSAPALEGKCKDALNKAGIMNTPGVTGHYDLFSNKGFKTVGCAHFRNPSAAKCARYSGIWGCDFGNN